MPGSRRFKAEPDVGSSRRPAFAGALMAVSVAAATAQAQEAPLEALPRPEGAGAVHTLKADGPPQTHGAGRVAVGDVLVSTPARHALTGVLRLDVHRDGRTVVPAGTEVFGIRISATVRMPTTAWARRNGVPGTVVPVNDQTIWCLVQPPRKADAKTICLPMMGGIYRWVEAEPPLYPAISATSKSPMVDGPLVDPGPVQRLPPLRLSLAFGGWTPDGARIVATIDGGDGAPAVLHRFVPRDADGSVILRVQGGRLHLAPVPGAPEAAELTILTPPSPSAAPW